MCQILCAWTPWRLQSELASSSAFAVQTANVSVTVGEDLMVTTLPRDVSDDNRIYVHRKKNMEVMASVHKRKCKPPLYVAL